MEGLFLEIGRKYDFWIDVMGVFVLKVGDRVIYDLIRGYIKYQHRNDSN